MSLLPRLRDFGLGSNRAHEAELQQRVLVKRILRKYGYPPDRFVGARKRESRCRITS